MITQILFEIPAAFEAAVKAGSLVQIGGLLKDATSGQIVAHLQESGLGHALVSKLAFGAFSPVSLIPNAINLGTGVYTAVQVTQMKAMIAALQSLQIATLGVSLVGIGVSIGGFVYMHKRFNSLDDKIDKLIETVNAGFESQQKTAIRAHMHQVKGLVKRARQAPSLSRPEKEYSRIADALADQSAHFEGELEFVIRSTEKINLDFFWQLTQVLMMCNSARIECRMRTNELRNAVTVAESSASEYQRLFEPLTPLSFDASELESSLAVKTIKDITDAAATKPYLIDYLRANNIDGREYLQVVENECQRPLLMLKTT